MSRQRAQGRRGRALCLALEGTQRAGLGERYASAAGHRLQARVGALTNAVAPSEAGRGGEPVPDYHSKMAREDAECRCGKSRFLGLVQGRLGQGNTRAGRDTDLDAVKPFSTMFYEFRHSQRSTKSVTLL